MATCVALHAVSKRFAGRTALETLSLEVERGEVLALLGPNGAGKSTTLHLIAGLMRPDSGTIRVFGKEARRHGLEIAGRMGVALERPAFYEHLSVRQNLRAQAMLAQRAVNVDRALDLVGLLEEGDTRAGVLSQGMRQRLSLAQAMLTEPELLLLDEPANALDLDAAAELLRYLRRAATGAKVTIIFACHQLHEVEMACDRAAILEGGRLLACERVDALLTRDPTRCEVLLEGAEGAAKRLLDQTWVISAEARPGCVQVHLRDANPQQLVSFLIGAGYPLAGLIPQRRSLREVMLRITNTRSTGGPKS